MRLVEEGYSMGYKSEIALGEARLGKSLLITRNTSSKVDVLDFWGLEVTRVITNERSPSKLVSL